MVLDDVACRADAVVVAGAAAHADVLGHGDLHVVDEVGVPDRLVQLVREAQRQDVLDRLLAEVVVDAEHRVGREHRRDDVVQLAGRLQVGAERLLDDHAAPLVVVLLGEARALQLRVTTGNDFGGIDR